MSCPVRWLVVDAMNVIGSRPDGWWHDRGGAVTALVDAIRVAAPHLGADRVTVVVDGQGPDTADHDTAVEVLWAGRGPDAADDRIVALLEASDTPATVVTADRRLRARVTALGANVDGPRGFRDRLDVPPP